MPRPAHGWAGVLRLTSRSEGKGGIFTCIYCHSCINDIVELTSTDCQFLRSNSGPLTSEASVLTIHKMKMVC